MSSSFVENTCLRFLLDAQNEDGGWGFHTGSTSRAEPTAWAVVALVECAFTQAHKDAASRAFHFLDAAQLPDGSWPSSPALREGSWVTSLACLALLGQNELSGNVKRGFAWLCKELPGEAGLLHRIVRSFFARKKVGTQNESYFGWSWTIGTASWVEPTSYAIISMRATPPEWMSAAAKRRLRIGEAMLFDRMCPGGGWNCGNPMVYGVPGEPQVSSSVWALLALREHPQRPEVQQSLDWLQGQLESIRSPASLALALMAMNAYGRPYPLLAESLQTKYEQDEILWDVPEVAWTALALSGTQNWLKQKSNGKS
ncbi:MAG: prenyltransferase/squalene oxidase repeat-containing protein [Candidatus Acidiferrales bacterium]